MYIKYGLLQRQLKLRTAHLESLSNRDKNWSGFVRIKKKGKKTNNSWARALLEIYRGDRYAKSAIQRPIEFINLLYHIFILMIAGL